MNLRLAVCVLTLVIAGAAQAEAQAIGKPTTVAPGGAVIGDTHSFTWTAVSGATWYQLWATDAGGAFPNEWITVTDAKCASGESVCSVSRTWPLVTGDANWWVRAWSPSAGNGEWSDATPFSIAGRTFTVAQSDTEGNTVLGFEAMKPTGAETKGGGGGHVAIGYKALLGFNSAFDTVNWVGNTAVGSNALKSLITDNGSGLASGNTGIGYRALPSLASGNLNIALGSLAGGFLQEGTSNIYIGNFGQSVESNTIRIGQTAHTRAFMAGISGVTSASGVQVFVNSSGQLGTTTSSQRFKENIRPIDRLSERLYLLRPVAFKYKSSVDPDALTQFGLIAEDVEKTFPELLVRDAEGKPETVRYHLLTPLLLNELQKQQVQLDRQQQVIDAQAAQLRDLAAKVELLLGRSQRK